MGQYLTLAVVMLATMAAASCSRAVTVQRSGSSAPWTCADKPPRPQAQDGGFHPNLSGGYSISTRDTNAVTDYLVELEGAYRSCRAVVDQINALGQKGAK